MNISVIALMLLIVSMAGSEEPDEHSIPAPTAISALAAEKASDVTVTGRSITIKSNESSAEVTLIEIATANGEAVIGVMLKLQSPDQEDALYLDPDQADQIREEFVDLARWYKRNEKCGAQRQCVHGIARCRPSQTIQQAFCPGFFSTPGGERGVIVSTPHGSFRFPSVEPAKFANAIESTINHPGMAQQNEALILPFMPQLMLTAESEHSAKGETGKIGLLIGDRSVLHHTSIAVDTTFEVKH